MKKIILGLLLIVVVAFGGDLKINGNVDAVSNYILFGASQSEDKPSINSMVNIDYKGIFVTTHANSIVINNENILQTWFKLGYNYNIDPKSYVKVNYVRDESIDNKYKDGNFAEFSAGTGHLNFIYLDLYNLYNLDTSDFDVHRLTATGQINEDISLTFIVGTVVDTRDWAGVKYTYNFTKYFNYYVRGIYAINENKQIDKNVLVGVSLHF